MRWNLKEEHYLLILLIIFILGYLSIDPAYTGYAFYPTEKINVKVDPLIVQELNQDNKADVIIVLKDDANKEEVIGDTNKFKIIDNLKVKRKFNEVNGIAGELNKEGLENLKKNPDVKAIYIDHKIQAVLDNSANLIQAKRLWPIKYNDEYLTGKGETVCLIDTGVDYNHPSLKGRVINGYDFINNDDDAMDNHGHGTHLAGIIASNDTTYKGIAPESNILAVKILSSSGGGSESDLAAGIEYCLNNNVSIISLSLGIAGSNENNSSFCDQFFAAESINNAYAQGALVFVSSGNDGFSNGINYPACSSNATSVGAVDDNDNVPSFSNSAAILDLLAPGVSITSTKLNGGFVTYTGTSMATPHAAATVAVLKQYNRLENNSQLTNQEILNILKSSGVNIRDSRNDLIISRADASNSLGYIDTFPPVLSIAILNESNNVSVIWDALDVNDINYEAIAIHYDNSIILEETSKEINLVNLSPGEYSVHIFANDTLGYGSSLTTSFIISNETEEIPAEVIEEDNSIYATSLPDNNYVSEGNITFTCSAQGNNLTLISIYNNLTGNFIVNDSFNAEGNSSSAVFEVKNINTNQTVLWSCYAESLFNSTFSENKTAFVIINIPSAPEETPEEEAEEETPPEDNDEELAGQFDQGGSGGGGGSSGGGGGGSSAAITTPTPEYPTGELTINEAETPLTQEAAPVSENATSKEKQTIGIITGKIVKEVLKDIKDYSIALIILAVISIFVIYFAIRKPRHGMPKRDKSRELHL